MSAERIHQIRKDRGSRDFHEQCGERMLREAEKDHVSALSKQMFAARAGAHFTAAMYYLRKAGT